MLGTVLPLALVVGLSPLPIMPVLLLLTTPRATANGWAYLGAWLISLSLLVAAAIAVAQLSDPAPASEEGIGWIQVITGTVFLVMALVKWTRRPRDGTKEQPGWMAALTSYVPSQSARLGALLAGANPKNVAMALAAGAAIAVLAEGPAHRAVGLLGFVLVGSLGVATPILARAVLGERATTPLASLRAWLDANSTMLSVGVLAVLGVLLVLKGLPTAL